MSEVSELIVLEKLKVHDANAVSGPLSWGFPPPSTFLGFVHALNLQIPELELGGVGIICHEFNPQIAIQEGGRPHTFILMRYPYKESWRQKSFNAHRPSALIQEGRAHFKVTLLIEYLGRDSLTEDEKQDFCSQIQKSISSMRIAGGRISIGSSAVKIDEWPETAEAADQKFCEIRYKWLPGFALVDRRDLLVKHLNRLRSNLQDCNPLEALVDILALHTEPQLNDESQFDRQQSVKGKSETEWETTKREPGWLVPLPVGFGSLSDLHERGSVLNVRDTNVPFKFVESLYSIGEWISPHRLSSLNQILWHRNSDLKKGLYLCENNYYKENLNGK